MATMRTTKRRPLRFLPLIKEITFFHMLGARTSGPLLSAFLLLTAHCLLLTTLKLAKLAQIPEAVNACLVSVTPFEVQSITPHDGEVFDLYLFRDCFRFQCALSGPLIHALGAGTSSPQYRGLILAHPLIRPGDAQAGIALLHYLSRLDRQPSLNCRVAHNYAPADGRATAPAY